MRWMLSTRGWQHEAEHEKVGGQLQELTRELKRDAQLESMLKVQRQGLGITDGSRLDEVLRERNLQMAMEISVRGRSRGLGR